MVAFSYKYAVMGNSAEITLFRLIICSKNCILHNLAGYHFCEMGPISPLEEIFIGSDCSMNAEVQTDEQRLEE